MFNKNAEQKKILRSYKKKEEEDRLFVKLLKEMHILISKQIFFRNKYISKILNNNIK